MTSPPNLEQPRRRLTSGVIPALAIAGIAGLVSLLMVGRLRDDAAAGPPEGCIIEGAALIGGPISLMDARSQPVTQADFAGEPAVLYFGFTHCPDVCPTTMYQLAEALKLPGGQDLQPILISVDPERDTPEVLAAYVHTEGFPEGLQGLTGTLAQVQAAAEAFKVVRQRAPIEGAPAEVYNVDHTSFLYVMDGEWRTRAVLPTQGRTPQDIAACIDAGLAGA
jgi:protein SCO1/2